MKRVISIFVLSAVLSAACSTSGAQEAEQPTLQRKKLTSQEQQYLQTGLDRSAVYTTKRTFPEQIKTAKLIMNVYENGEKIKESYSDFQFGVNYKDQGELKELLFGVNEQKNEEGETTTLELIIGDTYINDENNTSRHTYANTVNMSLPSSWSSMTVPQAPIEAGRMSYLSIMTSGNSLTTGWYEKENRKRIINRDEKVIIFGIKWLKEKPSQWN